MQYEHERSGRTVADDAARDRTVRRLLAVRLRRETARREAARPCDSRIGQARREIRALTGARPAATTGAVGERLTGRTPPSVRTTPVRRSRSRTGFLGLRDRDGSHEAAVEALAPGPAGAACGGCPHATTGPRRTCEMRAAVECLHEAGTAVAESGTPCRQPR